MDPNKNGVVDDDAADDVRLAMDELKKAQPEPEEKEAPEKQVEALEAKEPVETKTEDRPRGPDGKFIKKEADEPTDTPPAPETPQPVQAQEQAPVAGVPPRGWTVGAKAKWDAFAKQFPELAQEVAKRETDVSNGFKQYEGLGQYAERAARSGTTVAGVLQRYVGMEDALRQNPEQGLALITQNLGMTQHEAAQLFARLAQRYGAPQSAPAGETAPNGTAPQGFDPNAFAPILTPLQQKISELERTLSSQIEANRATHTRAIESAIERFRSNPANRYFDNVEDSIAKIFESGMVERTADPAQDLAKAYELACWHNPEIRPLLIKEQAEKSEADRKQKEREVAQRAKAASKSLNGSPAPGTIVHGLEDKDDVYADAAKAVRQHSMQ